MLTSFRLFTRAPCTRIRSWLSAMCGSVSLALLMCLPGLAGPSRGPVVATGSPAAFPVRRDVRQVSGVPGSGASRFLTGRVTCLATHDGIPAVACAASCR